MVWKLTSKAHCINQTSSHKATFCQPFLKYVSALRFACWWWVFFPQSASEKGNGERGAQKLNDKAYKHVAGRVSIRLRTLPGLPFHHSHAFPRFHYGTCNTFFYWNVSSLSGRTYGTNPPEKYALDSVNPVLTKPPSFANPFKMRFPASEVK